MKREGGICFFLVQSWNGEKSEKKFKENVWDNEKDLNLSEGFDSIHNANPLGNKLID